MSAIDDIRKRNPTAAGLSDADIIRTISDQTGIDPATVASDFGVKQNDPGFWTSFKQGLGANLEGVGQAIDDASDGRPGALTRYGRDVQFRNPSSAASESWDGFKEHPWEGLKQFAGSALGSTAPSLAMALIPGMQPEAAASAGVAMRGLQLARSLPAQALVAAAPSYGQIRNDQREQGLGDEPGAVGRAALGALATGGVEVGFGVQGALNRFNNRAAREAVVDEFGRTPMRTLAKNWGRSALEEGGEEIIQQPIQQAAAYQDPTTPENLRDTAWSGFGGLVGGAFLGPMGAAPMAVRHAQINGRIATDLLNPDAPLSQQQDAALWQRAFDTRDLGAEQAAANYGQTMEEVNRQRLGSLYWGQPVDLLADVQTNEAAREEARSRFDAFRGREARAGFLRDLEGAPHDNPLYAAIPTPVDNYLRQYREDHTPVGENYSLPIPGAFVRGQLPEQATPGYYDGGEEVQPATPNNRQGSFVDQLDMTLQPGYARTQVANDTSVGLPGNTAPTGQFDESGTLANLRAATVQQLVPMLQNGGEPAYSHMTRLAITSREPDLMAKVARAASIARQFRDERVAAVTGKKTPKAAKVVPAKGTTPQPVVQPQAVNVPQRRQARVELRQKLEDAKRSQAITEDSYLLLRNALDTGAKVEKVKADLDKAAKEVADAKAPNTFDNRADFTDWALNRVGAKEHEAEAYKRWKAIGEFAGEEPASFDMLTQVFPEQTRGKGKGKKPTHTTVQNRMKVLHQLVSDLEAKHLSEAQNESVQTEEVTPGEAISEEEAKTGLTQRGQSADSVVHPEAEGEDKDTETHGDSGAVGAEVTKRGRKEWEARSTGEEAIKFDDLAPEMQVAWSDTVGSLDESRGETSAKAYLDKKHSEFVSGLEAAGYTVEASTGKRTVKALSEKDTTGADAARAKVLAEAILTGDTDVAVELLQLLDGKTGATLMQMLRTRFSMPRTAVTPKAAVEYLVGKFNTLRAAVVERSNEMAKVWGPGFDSLPEAAKLDFYEAVEGVGDMVNTPSILRQIKGDILNEYGIRQAAESVPANARRDESSDAQRPELRGNGEGVATSGQDQSASGPTVTTKKRRTIAREEVKRSTNSEATKVTTPTTVAAIRSHLKGLFFSGHRFDSKVVVVQSSAGLDPELRSKHDGNTQAFVKNGKVYLIANNIQQGNELAVFLHEVGVHLGMEKLLGPENYAKLVEQVKQWAENSDGKEGELARKALRRTLNAEENLGEEYGQKDFDDELLAYFVEESVLSGTNPTAISKAGGPMANWFRTFWAAVKIALRKFGLDRIEQLSAQNLVDIAYGAARLELEGTWHGTAADFRNFNHTYMGSGEGAQAFGWGTYLAQRVGIAKGYWKQDVGRKYAAPNLVDKDGNKIKRIWNGPLGSAHNALVQANGDYAAARAAQTGFGSKPVLAALDVMEKEGVSVRLDNPEGSLMRVDVNVHDDEFLDWDKPLSEQSEVVKKALEQKFISKQMDKMTGEGWSEPGENFYRWLEAGFGSDKKASEYLDSIGIKGIKFLDSTSRDYANAKFKIEEAGPFRTRLEKKKPWTVEIERNGGYRTMNFATKAEAEAWVAEKKTATRNLVVFNDKNIVRVATQRGARLDSSSIKYSKADDGVFHRKQTVETLKFKDVSGNEYEETVVSFPFATHPHVREAVKEALNGPMRGVFSLVKGIYFYEGRDDFVCQHPDGAMIVLSKTTVSGGKAAAKVTLDHELAHVADNASVTEGGIFSNSALFDVAVSRARKLHASLPKGNPIHDFLDYPFNPAYDESKTDLATRMEVYAQLVSAVQHPGLAALLNKHSPVLYQIAKEALDEIQQTYPGNAAVENARGVSRQSEQNVGRSGQSATQAQFRRNQRQDSQENFLTQAQDKVSDSLVNSRGGFKKHLLGWLTLEQLSDVVERMVDKASSATVTTYNAVMTKMQQASKEIVYRASMIDEKWASVSPAVAAKLSNVMRTATRYGFDPEAEKPGNDFQQKLAAEFNALPVEAKELYKQVRDFYAGLYNERRDILLKAAESTKDAAGNTAEVKRLLKAVKGPYFPLMRIGEWYSVGMSKEVKALMDKKKTDGLSAAEEKQLTALRKDAKHYVARGHLTRAEAVRSAKELESMGFSNWNTASSKLQNEVRTLPDFQKLEAALVAELPKAVQDKARNMVAEMYFAALADNSALKQLMHREGIYGEETDMRRVFAATALSSAHHISRMKYADDLSAAMMAVRNAASDQTGDDTMRMVENELTKRVELAMDNEHSDFANRLLQTSYFAHLGLSPAFVLTNMSQVPMITAPWLVARHGFGASTRSIVAAYSDVTKMMKSTYSGGNLLAELKWDSVLNEDESKLFRDLIDRNKLDITIEADLGSVANMQNTKLDKYIKLANAPVRITELANRAVTGLSAYRLGRSKGMSHDAAVDYAAKAVTETQLDYSALNAPRHMRSVFGSKTIAKLMFQFRKYQQGMLYLIVKNFHDAFKAADPEERRIARTTLYGLFTMSGAMAGAIGLPFAGAVTFIANAIAGGFGDGDDPFDAEVELRNLLADAVGADAAEVFMKGLPTLVGADLSKRVGMGDLASPLPFMRQGKTGSEKLDKAMLASLGASYGMMQQIADGLGEMASGDFAKGAEKVLPLKVASNLIRTARYADEGLTNKNGELVLAPEKFSSWDLALRAAGFQPTIEADYYAANQAVESAKQAASDARTKLLRDYAQSTLKGEDTTGIEQKMQDYNERHPEKGYRIDFSAKLKAIQTRVKMQNERNEVGVKTDARSQPFLQRARFAE